MKIKSLLYICFFYPHALVANPPLPSKPVKNNVQGELRTFITTPMVFSGTRVSKQLPDVVFTEQL